MKITFLPRDHYYLFTILALLISVNTNAKTLEFSSGEERVNLIELYTSEGCSSCPPADLWISKLKQKEGLWKKFVPVTFHVDYWDHLGRKDKYANPLFAKRQEIYASHRFVSSVYTPAVLLNGRGWQSWRFKNDFALNDPETRPGRLKSILKNDVLFVEFLPEKEYSNPLIVNIALLGTNLKSNINSGENEGKILNHDFVVLAFLQKYRQDEQNHWQVNDLFKTSINKPDAITVWLSQPDDPTPIQAAGSWLK